MSANTDDVDVWFDEQQRAAARRNESLREPAMMLLESAVHRGEPVWLSRDLAGVIYAALVNRAAGTKQWLVRPSPEVVDEALDMAHGSLDGVTRNGRMPSEAMRNWSQALAEAEAREAEWRS